MARKIFVLILALYLYIAVAIAEDDQEDHSNGMSDDAKEFRRTWNPSGRYGRYAGLYDGRYNPYANQYKNAQDIDLFRHQALYRQPQEKSDGPPDPSLLPGGYRSDQDEAPQQLEGDDDAKELRRTWNPSGRYGRYAGLYDGRYNPYANQYKNAQDIDLFRHQALYRQPQEKSDGPPDPSLLPGGYRSDQDEAPQQLEGDDDAKELRRTWNPSGRYGRYAGLYDGRYNPYANQYKNAQDIDLFRHQALYRQPQEKSDGPPDPSLLPGGHRSDQDEAPQQLEGDDDAKELRRTWNPSGRYGRYAGLYDGRYNPYANQYKNAQDIDLFRHQALYRQPQEKSDGPPDPSLLPGGYRSDQDEAPQQLEGDDDAKELRRTWNPSGRYDIDLFRHQALYRQPQEKSDGPPDPSLLPGGYRSDQDEASFRTLKTPQESLPGHQEDRSPKAYEEDGSPRYRNYAEDPRYGPPTQYSATIISNRIRRRRPSRIRYSYFSKN
ncbi:hypothetical protein JTB14_003420 [Gonioctena quinquepunctata]|nr:hypothetical protein JTB14_003420 [Gonioctena quinquepunctata]